MGYNFKKNENGSLSMEKYTANGQLVDSIKNKDFDTAFEKIKELKLSIDQLSEDFVHTPKGSNQLNQMNCDLFYMILACNNLSLNYMNDSRKICILCFEIGECPMVTTNDQLDKYCFYHKERGCEMCITCLRCVIKKSFPFGDYSKQQFKALSEWIDQLNKG